MKQFPVMRNLLNLVLCWYIGTCVFISQCTSTKRQRRDLIGLRVKLPPVTTTQR